MSTIQLIGIGAATVILIILVIALIVTRRRERRKAHATDSVPMAVGAPTAVPRPAAQPQERGTPSSEPHASAIAPAGPTAEPREPPPAIVTSSQEGAATHARTEEQPTHSDLWRPAPPQAPAQEASTDLWQTPSPAEYAAPLPEPSPSSDTASPTETPPEPHAEKDAIPAASEPPAAVAGKTQGVQEEPAAPPPPPVDASSAPPTIPMPPGTDALAGWGGPLDEEPAEDAAVETAPVETPPMPDVADESAPEAAPAAGGTDTGQPAEETPGIATGSSSSTGTSSPADPAPKHDAAAPGERRLVPLCDIISTTNTQQVDLDDPDVRRMLRELVQNEVDLAQQYKQLGQNIDAVLQLTEAEKICRALSMDAHADLLRKMIRELQG